MRLDTFCAAQLQRIRERLTQPLQRAPVWHGTLNGYRVHGCRCLPCRAAFAQHKTDRRRQQGQRRQRAAEYATRAERRAALRDHRERAIAVHSRHRVTHGLRQRPRSEAWHLRQAQVRRRLALRQELGLCRDCPVALTAEEQGWGYVRCDACRQRHREQQRVSAARKGVAA